MNWQSQIRTNLDDEIYVRHVEELVRQVPGVSQAAIVNTRFREICCHNRRGGPDPGDANRLTELTVGLFGPETGAPSRAYLDAFRAIGVVQSGSLVFREETLLFATIPGDRLLLLVTSASLNMGACAAILQAVSGQIAEGGTLSSFVDPSGEVLAGALVGVRSTEIVDRYERFPGPVLQIDAALAQAMCALCSARTPPPGLRLMYRDQRPVEIRRAELLTSDRTLHWSRVQFDPEHLLVVCAEPNTNRGLIWNGLREREVEVVRVWVDGLLRYGVPSTMSPFPETQREFLEIVERLRNLHENDLLGRLDIAGFANYTVGEGDDMQRCMECIYYLPNRRWCDLPELPLPVEPDWWCRLWKI